MTTQYQAKFLEHLVDVALGNAKRPGDKRAAWESAKNFALLDPFQLSELPTLLTQEMKRLQLSKDCASATASRAT